VHLALGLVAMAPRQTPILLIRHGETPWNAAGRWQGHADPGLTEAGRKQAQGVAQALAGEPSRPWSGIVASDLARARETASALASALALSIEFDPRLRELDVGSWSGLTRAEIAERDPDTLLAFERGEPTIRPGGGESRIEIRERAQAVVRDFAERRSGEHLIVVTHLGVIRALAPGSEPTNAGRIEILAEEVAARGVDRTRRREDGAL
jgi:broad specificity phosphatase PhoE